MGQAIRRGQRCRARAAALALLVLSGVGAADAATTLVYCMDNNPLGWMPPLYADVPTHDANLPLYDRLLGFKPGTSELVPALATSWDIARDGRSYTFHLRQGVHFHPNFGFTPTRTMNADDVMFSFNRQFDPHHPYHAVSGGTYDSWNSLGLNKLVAGIDRIDDLTVRFRLTHPNATFLSDLAIGWAAISSAEYANWLAARGRQQDFDLKPVGTGPFVLTGFRPDTDVRYRAAPDYWRGPAKVDAMVYAITRNPSVRLAKVRAGECQIAGYLQESDLQQARRDPNLRVISEGSDQNTYYLGFNVKRPPLDDVRVRRALAMAIDKKAIVNAVYLGQAKAATSPIPPSVWGGALQGVDPAYDPAAARRLLQRSGHGSGLKLELMISAGKGGSNPSAQRTAEIVQSDWAKIGVDTRIVNYEWGEFLKHLQRGDQMTSTMIWIGDNGDPDNFLANMLGCAALSGSSNMSKWCDPGFQQLLDRALLTTDRGARTALYRQALQIVRDQQPMVSLVHRQGTVVTSPRVHGLVLNPSGALDLYGVSLDPAR